MKYCCRHTLLYPICRTAGTRTVIRHAKTVWCCTTNKRASASSLSAGTLHADRNWTLYASLNLLGGLSVVLHYSIMDGFWKIPSSFFREMIRSGSLLDVRKLNSVDLRCAQKVTWTFSWHQCSSVLWHILTQISCMRRVKAAPSSEETQVLGNMLWTFYTKNKKIILILRRKSLESTKITHPRRNSFLLNIKSYHKISKSRNKELQTSIEKVKWKLKKQTVG